MAQKLFEQDQLSLTRKAGGTLTASRFVKTHSDTEQVVAASVQGEQCLGVVESAWASGDEAVRVIYAGVVMVEAGGTIAVGDMVTNDSDGKAIKAGGTAQADFIHGRAMSAGVSGNLVSVLLFEMPLQGTLANIGAGRKRLVIPIASGAGDESAAAQDTGYTFPAKAIVFADGVFVDVTDAEASTIDVGRTSDPNGYLAAVSIAGTGLVKGTLLNTGQTLGALLAVDEDGAGVLVPEPDIGAGGENVVWQAAANLSSFAANIIIEYLEVA